MPCFASYIPHQSQSRSLLLAAGLEILLAAEVAIGRSVKVLQHADAFRQLQGSQLYEVEGPLK